MNIEQILINTFPEAIISLRKENNNIIVYTKKETVKILLLFIKMSSLIGGKMLLDIYGKDNLIPQKSRFELQYMILGVKKHVRIYIKTKIGIIKGLAKTISVVSIYPSAGYLERECWDLLGIFFGEHPDLRRIVTDYGFSGYPLRKDFPVTGFREIRYDDEKGKIIYEPIKYTQAYRLFKFETPWIKEKN